MPAPATEIDHAPRIGQRHGHRLLERQTSHAVLRGQLSTIATRTSGRVTKQNRSGRVSASMRSASAYCATSRPSSEATAFIRGASNSHNAITSKRSGCASHPSRWVVPRPPQPACATRIFPMVYSCCSL